MPEGPIPGGRTSVRIVVVGDRATGKSSLIAAAASETFSREVPPVLPPTRLPADFYPDNYHRHLIQNRGRLAEELKRADAVVLTYACDQPTTLNRISSFWLYELHRLEIRVPVVVVGCKLDRRDEEYNLNIVMAPIMRQFREIETCIECSTANLLQYSTMPEGSPSSNSPLFDQETQALKPHCMRALKRIFVLCDLDMDIALNDEELNGFQDDVLRNTELEDLFSTAPETPWDEAPYKDAVERTPLGGLSLSGFLSEWALMTLLDPVQSLANSIYIGYNCNAASALNITRRRSIDRKKQQTERSVFQCFVFGSKKSGKSALLMSLLGRPFSDNYVPTNSEQYVVNMVEQHAGNKKTLVLREIPEDGVKKLLSNKESLAGCDVAIFVCDSSSEYSLRRASELLVVVTKKGEETGFSMPCLLVVGKHDLGSYPLAMKESAKICLDMGIDEPIPVSVKEIDLNNVFSKIVNAAENPHLSVPETDAGQNRKLYHQLVNRSLIFVSAGAANCFCWNGSIPSLCYKEEQRELNLLFSVRDWQPRIISMA